MCPLIRTCSWLEGPCLPRVYGERIISYVVVCQIREWRLFADRCGAMGLATDMDIDDLKDAVEAHPYATTRELPATLGFHHSTSHED
ncbi:hypothetical protein OESDEN_02991 [Oesophagostomum dentatum]|uniref:Uncharacterized protein n=1 Tax=Oesophagostomum dentatum TaxID=61180 RepID=A0A0B1TLR2_OESDE|nr:hypothetical protein OESDEN_02991 [Oesophagostomum dentatum]